MDFVSTSKARLSKVVKQRVNMRMKTKDHIMLYIDTEIVDHLVHVISLCRYIVSIKCVIDNNYVILATKPDSF